MRCAAVLATLVLVLPVAACGGGGSPRDDSDDYPLVSEPKPEFQEPLRTASGAIVRRPVKPTVYEAKPSASCERMLATFHDGTQPARRPIVIPPAPGLRAQALSEREIVLEWSFRQRPDDCQPRTVLLSIVANDDVNATPTTALVEVESNSGSTRLVYPDFLSHPDVASASASTAEGRRSRTRSVLIRS